MVLDNKANWNFTNRERQSNRSKLNSNRVSKRSSSMLNQDLMLDFAADHNDKQSKKTSYKNCRKSSGFVNNKKHQIPNKYFKQKRTSEQHEDPNAVQTSKLK